MNAALSDGIECNLLDIDDFSSISPDRVPIAFSECMPLLEKCIIDKFNNSRHVLKYGFLEHDEMHCKNFCTSIRLSDLRTGIKAILFEIFNKIARILLDLMKFDDCESNVVKCSKIFGAVNPDQISLRFDIIFLLNVDVSKISISVPSNFFDKISYEPQDVQDFKIDNLFFYKFDKRIPLIDIMGDGSAIVYGDNFNKYREEILDKGIITFI